MIEVADERVFQEHEYGRNVVRVMAPRAVAEVDRADAIDVEEKIREMQIAMGEAEDIRCFAERADLALQAGGGTLEHVPIALAERRRAIRHLQHPSKRTLRVGTPRRSRGGRA